MREYTGIFEYDDECSHPRQTVIASSDEEGVEKLLKLASDESMKSKDYNVSLESVKDDEGRTVWYYGEKRYRS